MMRATGTPLADERVVSHILGDLIAVASDDESATIEELAIRAGLLWRCSHCGYNGVPSERSCGDCGRRRGLGTHRLVVTEKFVIEVTPREGEDDEAVYERVWCPLTDTDRYYVSTDFDLEEDGR